MSGKVVWAAWAHLFQADLLKKNNISFNEECENFAEDLNFYLEYIQFVNRISTTDYSGYNYIIHQNSMMAKSKELIRLNSMNEVSYHFYHFLDDKSLLKKKYSIIHFLIMNNQYKKIVGSERYPVIHEEIQKIKKIEWYDQKTKELNYHIGELLNLFGLKTTIKILLLTDYCKNKNWKRLSILSAIYYKVFKKIDNQTLVDL